MRAVAALMAKDLRLERRRPETLTAMALFAVTSLVIFHFALDRPRVEGDLAAGVLWVTLLLAAMLGVNRLFAVEREQGGFDGFRLAPVDPTALLVAKAAALFTFLVVLELILVPVFAVLLLGPPLWPALPQLVGILLLGDLGIAVVGALGSALAVQTNARELIGPLVCLPLLIPLLIAAARATEPLLAAPGAQALAGRWPVTLALYDLVFALLAYAVFDFLLED